MKLSEAVQQFGPVVRAVAAGIVLAGVLLLLRVLYRAVEGSLAGHVLGPPDGSQLQRVLALMLSLPVPLHVISVGLIIRKRWLSPGLAKIAWFAVVLSGTWLGLALGIKFFWFGTH